MAYTGAALQVFLLYLWGYSGWGSECSVVAGGLKRQLDEERFLCAASSDAGLGSTGELSTKLRGCSGARVPGCGYGSVTCTAPSCLGQRGGGIPAA